MAIPPYAVLADLKARLGLTDTTYNSTLTDILDGVGAAVTAYLGFDPTVTSVTEYLDTNGSEVTPLSRWPVTSITHVYRDENGNYGQTAGAFASTTELTQGTDYAWDVPQGSRVGRLTLIRDRWPWTWGREPLRLANAQGWCRGCLKCVYIIDNTDLLKACKLAAYDEAAAQFRAMGTGLGAVLSETVDSYSLTITQLQKRSGMEDSADGFVSPFAAQKLRPWRKARLV